MNWPLIINGAIGIFLIVTHFRIVAELRETPVQKGRVAGEAVWACVLVLVLLFNFGYIP